MLRAVVFFLLLQTFQMASSQDDGEASHTKSLETFFDSNADGNCSSIGGEVINGGGCYECYVCDDYSSRMQEKRKKNVYNIQLFDEACKPTQFCCYSQQDSVVRTSQVDCGTRNPSGVPRSIRNSLKSILPGEFPWRTWVFRKSDRKNPICAGIYFEINSRAILTSAKCVDDYVEEDLSVGFSRHNGNLSVRELIVHDHYNRESRHNDIAILLLSSSDSLPHWAQVACLPTSPPQIDTSCVAISHDDNYVNTLIPLQKRCYYPRHLNETILCSLTARGDYEPEFSSGLFCEKEMTTNKISVVVFGIYLYSDNEISIYTNISNYNDWIDNNVQPTA